MTSDSPSSQGPESSSSLVKLIHYLVVGLLLLGGLLYWWLKPPSLNPMVDARAAEAMALVHTHRSTTAPTILQALNEHVRTQMNRGNGVRLGEWRVQKLEDDLYEVRVLLREEGKTQWFEREYIWHANLAKRRVNAASIPADGLMPSEPPPGMQPSLPTSTLSLQSTG